MTDARENETPVFQSDMVKNWGKKNFWVPEVIFDGGKYYMFYSASASSLDDYMFYISCAVSDSPAGPFTEITGATKAASAPFHPNAPTPEFTSDGGKFTLTFTFESPVTLSQILLYNSTKDATLFESVKEVVIRTDKEKLTASDIAYPTAERAAKGVEIAGKTLYDLPLVMAFDETAGVKSVTITFDCEHAIGIPEIMMMGKVAEGK